MVLQPIFSSFTSLELRALSKPDVLLIPGDENAQMQAGTLSLLCLPWPEPGEMREVRATLLCPWPGRRQALLSPGLCNKGGSLKIAFELQCRKGSETWREGVCLPCV